MKTRFPLLGATLLFALPCASSLLAQGGPIPFPPPPGPPPPPRALAVDEGPVEVTFELFYESLDPFGDWIYVDGYGYCFRPHVAKVDPNWRPYTIGHWVGSDAGWTWVSDEDFGWACYHYGRWIQVGDTWAWVPGYEWGPGWVSWRANDDYVGWAPLPPEAAWSQDTGFDSRVDAAYDIGPEWYNFIPVMYFGATNYRPYCIDRGRNLAFVEDTRNFTHIHYRHDAPDRLSRIYNGGPRFDVINARSQTKLQHYRLDEDLRSPGRGRGPEGPPPGSRGRNRPDADHGIISVFAPRFAQRQPAQLAPQGVRERIGPEAIDRGWQRVDRGSVDALRRRMATERLPDGPGPGRSSVRVTEQPPPRPLFPGSPPPIGGQISPHVPPRPPGMVSEDSDTLPNGTVRSPGGIRIRPQDGDARSRGNTLPVPPQLPRGMPTLPQPPNLPTPPQQRQLPQQIESGNRGRGNIPQPTNPVRRGGVTQPEQPRTQAPQPQMPNRNPTPPAAPSVRRIEPPKAPAQPQNQPSRTLPNTAPRGDGGAANRVREAPRAQPSPPPAPRNLPPLLPGMKKDDERGGRRG